MRHQKSKPSHQSKSSNRFLKKIQRRSPASHVQRSRDVVDGIIQLKGSIGFVLSERPGVPDVLVKGLSLKLVMDGDRVRVKARPVSGSHQRHGEIIQVLKRARTEVVGRYETREGKPYLVPESSGSPLRLNPSQKHDPSEGDLVVAKITEWPTKQKPAQGNIVEILGKPGHPDVDLRALIYKHGLFHTFSQEAESDAQAFGGEVASRALEGRETFFHLPVVTIDGPDAKDFDDAISIESLDNGRHRLGIHIADVSHYVREGEPLDHEAIERGTSVYLAGSVLPMLPHALSSGLCSLRPDVVRLTVSCVMDVDTHGRVVSCRISNSAIRSSRRMTYGEAEEILRGKVNPEIPANIVSAIKEMGKLAGHIRRKRFERGSLDFDFPEPQLVLDKSGWPIDVLRSERMESHKLIEEFMILANESVAEKMQKFPFLYRIHEKPDATKLEKLVESLRAVGVTPPYGFKEGKNRAVQTVLRQVKGQPSEPMVHSMVLRSMNQAKYSMKNMGHYGLASRCYTHFTSPIRRYPDLCVHRILKDHLAGQLKGNRLKEYERKLVKIASRSSERERVAVTAEREFVNLKCVQLMKSRVGEVFQGVISSVMSFGFFVQLQEVFVEGLVPVRTLSDDYYIYDEVRKNLHGRRTKRIYRIGDEVRVRLCSANVEKRQIDLDLVK